jgi:TonB family protein
MVTALLNSPSTYANGEGRSLPLKLPADYEKDNLLLRWMEPEYPPAALRDGISGEVTLEFDIDRNGYSKDVEVVASTPAAVFDAVVLSAFRLATIYPYGASRCVKSFPRTRLTVRFAIEDNQPRISALPLVPMMPEKVAGNTSPSEAKASNAATPSSVKPKVKWKHTTKISYPLQAGRGYGMGGAVVVRVTIAADGHVSAVDTLLSSPLDIYGETVVKAIREWTAETLDGHEPGVEVTLCQPISFKIADH